MERHDELLVQSLEKLKSAQHILTHSYPLLKDPKLFMGVIDNMFLSMSYGMGALLHIEAKYKHIGVFPASFEDRLSIFESALMAKYQLKASYSSLMRHLAKVIRDHQKSSLVFVKQDRLVICQENYEMIKLDGQMLARHLRLAADFNAEMSSLIQKVKDEESTGSFFGRILMKRKV